tara:strand:+ start:1 stop:1095 length:1095 start_codon:yes stop_codon:yes gene_type:complete
MKKILVIFLTLILIPSFSFADFKEMKKMIMKSENYNLGHKKGDTTVNGLKLKPLMSKEAYKNAVKKKYGWLDYGFNIVHAKDGEPVRWGETAQRFELHIDDCGFIYKNGKYRDCVRNPPKHRFEIGQGHNEKKSLGYKHKQEYWYTFSYYLRKDFEITRDGLTVFQFHSDQGPYQPIFNIRITNFQGLSVDIGSSAGAFNDDTNGCDGGVKFKVNVCEAVLLKWTLIKPIPSEIKKLAGKWTDFIIHAKWDSRPSDHEKNEGLFEVFMDGKKYVHYEGQTAWNIGRAVLQYGIYEKKIPPTSGKIYRSFKYEDLKSIPTIVYYDEIWAKKKCEKLDLKRLGYSCKLLNEQSDKITPPDRKEINN